MFAADMVVQWNDNVLAAIRVDKTPPPKASRDLAIVHGAIYDAVNAIDRNFKPYAVDVPAIAGNIRLKRPLRQRLIDRWWRSAAF